VIYFYAGLLKEKMFSTKPHNGTGIRAMTAQLRNRADGNVIANSHVRYQEGVKQNGGHIENL
jgi:hypothetical protein